MESSGGLVPTKFTWRLGGSHVFLCGSFTRWVETVPMTPYPSQPGTFTCTVHLNPGYHQFKFIVDQEWRHDPGMPAMPDPIGNVNNWLFVRKPEDDVSQPPAPSAAPTSAPATAPPVEEDPRVTKSKIKDFLATHTAAELIPESAKVVLLDMDLPLRQALHALHEQATVFAPLFDSTDGCVRGVICASDFIATLEQLSSRVPMSEAEMDQHTIRLLLGYEGSEGSSSDGSRASDIRVDYVEPESSLQHVVDKLLNNPRSFVPIAVASRDGKIEEVLHSATLGGCLHQLLRHFRSSFSLMPLLAKSLDELGIGTWSNIATVSTGTLLTEALNMLKTYSCLPVVDEEGMLVDVYTRADIISLAKSNAYSRLQFEDVTVAHALSLSANAGHVLGGGSSSQFGGMSPNNMSPQGSTADFAAAPKNTRILACVAADPLKKVLRKMTIPGNRRLLVVDPENKKLLAICTIRDVARFLFV